MQSFQNAKIAPKGEYIKLKDGANKVRVVSQFSDYGSHYLPSQKENHTCIGKENNCRYCLAGDKPKVQYLVWVLDREEKEPKLKIFRFGYKIYSAILALAHNEDWAWEGDVMPYDITITKSGSGLETDYQVLGSPKKKELTEAEKEVIASKMTNLDDTIQAWKDKELKEQGVPIEKDDEPENDALKDIPVIEEGEDEDEIDVDNIPL